MKRKTKVFIAVVMTASFGFLGGDLRAGEVDELKAEMEKMRQEYEGRMQKLQAQLENLAAKQAEQEAKIEAKAEEKVEKKAEKKSVEVEYVGRYEGPFQKGGLLIKNPSGFGNVSVGGYADIEFENLTNTNSTFDQARLVLNVGAQPHEKLVFYSEYEIEHGGVNAADTAGEAKVEQAWIAYRINEMINLRGGIILVPFGKFNLLHDSDIQDLTERPLVARRIIPSTWMEAGAGAFGEIELGERIGLSFLPDSYINYETYVINGLDEDISDTGLRNAKGSPSVDVNNNKAVVGRLGIGLARNLEVGLNSYYGRFGRSGSLTSNGHDNLLGIGSDLTFRKGPFELVGDYAHFVLDGKALVDHDNNNATAPVAGPRSLRGFYIEPRYHFWPKFLNNTFLGKPFKDPTFTLVGRGDWVRIDDDGDASIGYNREWRYTAGLNYRPIESCVFKTEYLHSYSKNETLERGDEHGVIASAAIGF